MNNRRYYLFLFVIALMANGWLFFIKGFHYDAWIFGDFLRNQDHVGLKTFMDRLGLPIFYSMHWPFFFFKNFVLAYNTATFICFYLTSLLLFRITTQNLGLGKTYGALLASLYLTFPAYEMTMELALFPYVLCLFLFWVATWMVLQSRTTYRIAALVIYFISFSFNATLPLYAAAIFLFWYLGQNFQQTVKKIISDTFKWGLKNFDLMLLPFVFWIVKDVFWPRHGDQADYNTIKPNLERIADAYYSAYHVLKMQIPISLGRVGTNPLIFIFALIITLVALKKLLEPDIKRFKKLPVLIWAIFLFVFAVLPYAAVQLRFNLGGREGLYALVLGPAFAALTTLLIVVVTENFKRVRLDYFCAFFLAIFITNRFDRFIYWQKNYMKNESVILNLNADLDKSNLIYLKQNNRSNFSTDSEFEINWLSFMLKSTYPGKVKSVVLLHPAKPLNTDELKNLIYAYKMSNYILDYDHFEIQNPSVYTATYFDEKMDVSRFLYLSFFDSVAAEEYLKTLSKIEPENI